MSMKRLATLSSTTSNHGGLNYTEMSTAPGSPPPPIHGVNVMLGGAMLSGIILVVFIMCYCCHKNARKQESHMPAYWRDSGLPLHVYTVEGHQQCFDPEELVLCDMQVPVTPGPPPAYDAVVPIHKNIVSPARLSANEQHLLQRQLAATAHHPHAHHPHHHHHHNVVPAAQHQQQRQLPPSSDDSGLPSYEAALRLEVGHVFCSAKVHCPRRPLLLLGCFLSRTQLTTQLTPRRAHSRSTSVVPGSWKFALLVCIHKKPLFTLPPIRLPRYQRAALLT